MTLLRTTDMNLRDGIPQGKRPNTRKSLGEKEQEYLDALRVGFILPGVPGSCTVPASQHPPAT